MGYTAHMRDQVIVITGASGGIGAALAERVARAGGVAVLAARREAELEVVRARRSARSRWSPTSRGAPTCSVFSTGRSSGTGTWTCG